MTHSRNAIASLSIAFTLLIGLSIKIKQDTRKGFVKYVVNYGSGDLLEIKLDGIKQTYFIPFNEENVSDINLSMKIIILEW